MSTSGAIRSGVRCWIVTDEGDRWSVKLDVFICPSSCFLRKIEGD